MMQRITNALVGEAQRSAGTKSLPRRGIVSAYDPSNYAAKVRIQPEDVETGWLPVGSVWVGNGWGLFCPPALGDEVDVHFQEGGKNAGYISLRFFGNVARPLEVPAGELWLVHSSGSRFKLTNDGKSALLDAEGCGFVFNADGTGTIIGDITIQGRLIVRDDISDHNGTEGTLQDFRNTYDEHTHGGIQGGSGNTDVPNQQI